jgi:SHS2 domain-containing protein
VYQFDDHTSEVRLTLAAPTLAELFAEAGHGVADLLRGDLPSGAPVVPVDIALVATDLARLMADWIDELVFRSETSGSVFERFDPIVVTPAGELRATAHGHTQLDVKTQIKAATLYGLRVEPTETGWTASVVLDV